MINILTLKVGDKYGPEYVNRLYNGLQRHSTVPFKFYCYTEEPAGILPDINIIPLVPDGIVQKQFHKIHFHNMPAIEGKCLILDIDYVILQNVDDILSWDLKFGEFGCHLRWWSYDELYKCRINGGFQMFYQGETKHLYDIFMEKPEYWQTVYIKRMLAEGKLNGEQNFVDSHVAIKRSWLPPYWFGKFSNITKENSYISVYWQIQIDKENDFYLYDDGFDPRVKMVHFANDDNFIEDHDEDWIRRNWY